MCNEASLEARGGRYRNVGNPTEAALAVLAEKLGLPSRQATQALVDERRAVVAAVAKADAAESVAPPGACGFYKQR